MRRTLLCWLAPRLVGAGSWVPAAPAQNPATSPPPAAAAGPDPERAERPPPALRYAVAVLCSILVPLIVCMPSRKA